MITGNNYAFESKSWQHNSEIYSRENKVGKKEAILQSIFRLIGVITSRTEFVEV